MDIWTYTHGKLNSRRRNSQRFYSVSQLDELTSLESEMVHTYVATCHVWVFL